MIFGGNHHTKILYNNIIGRVKLRSKWRPTMNLTTFRHKNLLTRKEIADAVGVTIATVWNWENGRTKPGYKTRRKFIEVYGFDPIEEEPHNEQE